MFLFIPTLSDTSCWCVSVCFLLFIIYTKLTFTVLHTLIQIFLRRWNIFLLTTEQTKLDRLAPLHGNFSPSYHIRCPSTFLYIMWVPRGTYKSFRPFSLWTFSIDNIKCKKPLTRIPGTLSMEKRQTFP